MTVDEKIREEKLQYDINREAAKMSTLSPRKIGKYDLCAYNMRIICVRVRIRGKKCSFFGKLDVLCFLETPDIRPFDREMWTIEQYATFLLYWQNFL